jgi:very-short-patch-repair endonuclease
MDLNEKMRSEIVDEYVKNCLDTVTYNLERETRKCESPIEKTFLLAMLKENFFECSVEPHGMSFEKDNGPRIHPKPFKCLLSRTEQVPISMEEINYSWNGEPSTGSVCWFVVCPQYSIKQYRVDFLVRCFSFEVEWLDSGDSGDHVETQSTVLVECDGHDFHEKTKEQVARDKKRDREIKSLGFEMLRFSGSEIYKDPTSCAKEVTEYLIKRNRAKAEEHFARNKTSDKMKEHHQEQHP